MLWNLSLSTEATLHSPFAVAHTRAMKQCAFVPCIEAHNPSPHPRYEHLTSLLTSSWTNRSLYSILCQAQASKHHDRRHPQPTSSSSPPRISCCCPSNLAHTSHAPLPNPLPPRRHRREQPAPAATTGGLAVGDSGGHGRGRQPFYAGLAAGQGTYVVGFGRVSARSMRAGLMS